MSNKETKEMYKFVFPQKTIIDDREVKVDESGNETTVITKKPSFVDRSIRLTVATRRQMDDAELYYNVLVSKGIQAGLMSRQLLQKRFLDDGGLLAEGQKSKEKSLYESLSEKESQYYSLLTKQDKTQEDTESLAKIQKELALLKHELQSWEMSKMSIYDITAENRARNKTILWWLFELSQIKNDKGEWVALFPGKTTEEKSDKYHSLLEGEGLTKEDTEFYQNVISKCLISVSYWYYGRAESQEDFEKAQQEIDRDSKLLAE
jgi:hypothetical protein